MFDVIIIGSGPAGLNAGLYAKRKGLKTLLISETIGGQVSLTSDIENYLGFENISGFDLSEKFLNHCKGLNLEFKEYSLVTKIENFKEYKKVILENGEELKTKTLIIATGAKHRELNVKGEQEFKNKGVSYCTTCDAPFYPNKDVIICGGGNSAIEGAIDIAKIAKTVTIVHRSEFRADKILLDKLKEFDNVKIYLQTQVQEIFGDKTVKGLKAFDKKTKEEKNFFADAIFVEIGLVVDTNWLNNLINTNERGEILIDKSCRTNVDGIFAAGDVTDIEYKQIIVAAAEGAKAALAANEYINKIL